MTLPTPLASARSPARSPGVDKLKSLAHSAAIAVILLGAVVTIGWLKVEALKTFLPGLISMRPSTGLSFVLLGLALQQKLRPSPRGRGFWLLVGSTIGGSLLNLVSFCWNLSVNPLLLLWVGAKDANWLRMPPNSAIVFLLLGVGLLLLQRRMYRLAQLCCGIGFLVSFLALVGYVEQAEAVFAAVPIAQGGMAWHSALGFVMLAVGILCSEPAQGWMRTVSGENAGSVTLRTLLPAIFIAPLVIGVGVGAGVRATLYPNSLGDTLKVTLNVLVLAGLICWSARYLNAIDHKRQQLQRSLTEGEMRFKAVFEQAFQLVGLLQPDGTVIKINYTALRYFDLPFAAIAGVALWELPCWPEATQMQLSQAIERAITGHLVCLEVEAHPDGRNRTLSLSLKPLLDGAGEVVLLMFEAQDITERQQMARSLRQSYEQLEHQVADRTAQLVKANSRLLDEIERTHRVINALEVSESRLQMALDASQMGIWDLSPSTGNLVWSRQTEAIFGLPQGTFEGTFAAFASRVHPDDRALVSQLTADAIEQKVLPACQFRILWPDNSVHWIAARGYVHSDQNGCLHITGTTTDITEQRWAAEELRLVQQLGQDMIEAPTLLAGLESGLKKLCAAIGWNFAEAWIPNLDNTALVFHTACYGGAPRLKAFVAASAAITFPSEVGLPGRVWASQQPEWLLDFALATPEQYRRKADADAAGLRSALGVPILVDGDTIAVFVFYSFTPRLQDQYLVRLVQTVSDRLGPVIQRKQAEEQLMNSFALMETIFDSTPDPIFVKDLQGRYCMVNQATTEVLGVSEAELLGRDDTAIVPIAIAESLMALDHRVMTSGKAEVLEEQVPWKGEIHHFLSTKSPWRNAQGEVIGLIGVARDITDRVITTHAIHQLNQQLEERVRDRTAQLEAANNELEAFSYSVSHDLRAPLRSIDGFSQALLKRYSDQLDPSAQHYLNRIRVNTQRMSELIDDLLQLSRVSRGPLQRQPVNLSAIAQDAATQLSARDPDRVVNWTIAPTLLADGDPRLLQIVLENLLENAWKYTSRTATPAIEFGACPIANLTGATANNLVENLTEIVYFVRDNGAGFDMAYASKLFGAFQRLHDDAEFSGTGIGLATVARIVHRHGGEVGAIAAVNQGATVFFSL